MKIKWSENKIAHNYDLDADSEYCNNIELDVKRKCITPILKISATNNQNLISATSSSGKNLPCTDLGANIVCNINREKTGCGSLKNSNNILDLSYINKIESDVTDGLTSSLACNGGSDEFNIEATNKCNSLSALLNNTTNRTKYSSTGSLIKNLPSANQSKANIVCNSSKNSNNISDVNYIIEIESNITDGLTLINNEHSYSLNSYCLSNVKIPSVKVRGRPKSLGNTVIGLKRKRK